jgi:hypothetical protein
LTNCMLSSNMFSFCEAALTYSTIPSFSTGIRKFLAIKFKKTPSR